MNETIIKGAPKSITKIKCPRHFLINPMFDVFEREIVPELKHISKHLIDSGRVNNKRVKKDMFGNKIVDWRKVYAEEKKGNGNVIQPFITRAFAIEHIWDPKNPICVLQCKGRCKEGYGTVRERDIKRLHGS